MGGVSEAAARGEGLPASGPEVKVAPAPRSAPPQAAPAKPASATQQQRYSTQEVQEILSRAIERFHCLLDKA